MSIPPTPPTIEEILKTPPDKLPRNKQTELIHKREVWRQIYLPLLVGGAAVLGLSILTLMAGISGSTTLTRVWADISLVFVVAQVMLVVLPLLLVFGGLAYGVVYLLKILPPYLKVAQDYTALAAQKTEWVMRYVIEPVLSIKSAVAGLDNAIQTVRRFFGR